METKSKLFTALTKAQAEVKAAGKSGENKFDHYKYAMLQDYWEAVQEPMSKNGLCFPVSVTAIERLDDRQTAKGGVERVVQVELTGYLCHESGESMEFKCYGEGQDRSDKAIYKAVTGGKKYLIASVFNIPTTDDPETDSDAERGDQMDQRPPADRRPATTGRPAPQTAGNTPPSQDRRRPVRGRATNQQQPPRTATPDLSALPAGVTKAEPAKDDLPWEPEQPAALQPPPTFTKKEGCIGQSEYDQIIMGLHTKKIKKLKWLAYIKETYKANSASDLTMDQFQEVFALIYSNPAIIDPGMTF
jgi:hypothetical protein